MGSKKSKPTGRDALGQMQRLQEGLARAQAELAEETIEASTGGGAVRIIMSGIQECQGVHIDPKLFEAGDAEMLQDLVLLAVNQAIHDSQVLAARRLGPLTGGIGMPGAGG
jgi:DNA-binding YbaB/EbfC family protein